MIIRILGEGQYEAPDELLEALEPLDAALNAAIEEGDEAGYSAALDALLRAVRNGGHPLDVTTLVPSELTLPHEGSTLEDIRELLASEEVADAVAEEA